MLHQINYILQIIFDIIQVILYILSNILYNIFMILTTKYKNLYFDIIDMDDDYICECGVCHSSTLFSNFFLVKLSKK